MHLIRTGLVAGALALGMAGPASATGPSGDTTRAPTSARAVPTTSTTTTSTTTPTTVVAVAATTVVVEVVLLPPVPPPAAAVRAAPRFTG